MNVRSKDVSWQELDGHVVVLDLRCSVYLEINASGSLLWNLLVAGTDESQMREVLVSRYGISTDHAARDVSAFLTLARERDLLEG